MAYGSYTLDYRNIDPADYWYGDYQSGYTPTIYGDLTQPATSSISIEATRQQFGSVSFNAIGGSNIVGTRVQHAESLFESNWHMSTAYIRTSFSYSVLAGNSVLLIDNTVVKYGAMHWYGIAHQISYGLHDRHGIVIADGVGSLIGSSVANKIAGALIEATASLNAIYDVTRYGQIDTGSTSSLSLNYIVTGASGWLATGTGTLSGSAIVDRQAALAVSCGSALTATATVTRFDSAQWLGSSLATIDSHIGYQNSVSMDGTSDSNISGYAIQLADIDMFNLSNMSAMGNRTTFGLMLEGGFATQTTIANKVSLGSVNMITSSILLPAPEGTVLSLASMDGSGHVTINAYRSTESDTVFYGQSHCYVWADREIGGVINIVGDSGLSVVTGLYLYGSVSMQGTGNVDVDSIVRVLAFADLNGSGGVNINGMIGYPGGVVMKGAGSLSIIGTRYLVDLIKSVNAGTLSSSTVHGVSGSGSQVNGETKHTQHHSTVKSNTQTESDVRSVAIVRSS